MCYLPKYVHIHIFCKHCGLFSGVLSLWISLTLKQVFWKTKTFFKKLKYRFLVESTTIESVILSYKTAPSKTSIKANRMGSIKWTFTKKGVLPLTTLLFWKFSLSINSWFNVPTTQMFIFILFTSTWISFLRFFFVQRAWKLRSMSESWLVFCSKQFVIEPKSLKLCNNLMYLHCYQSLKICNKFT